MVQHDSSDAAVEESPREASDAADDAVEGAVKEDIRMGQIATYSINGQELVLMVLVAARPSSRGRGAGLRIDVVLCNARDCVSYAGLGRVFSILICLAPNKSAAGSTAGPSKPSRTSRGLRVRLRTRE